MGYINKVGAPAIYDIDTLKLGECKHYPLSLFAMRNGGDNCRKRFGLSLGVCMAQLSRKNGAKYSKRRRTFDGEDGYLVTRVK